MCEGEGMYISTWLDILGLDILGRFQVWMWRVRVRGKVFEAHGKGIVREEGRECECVSVCVEGRGGRVLTVPYSNNFGQTMSALHHCH